MIFWKEWRRLRGRFLSLAAFYLITAALADLEVFGEAIPLDLFQVWFLGWGAAMLLIPAILGMDAYVGERDEGTEDFLYSKPIGRMRLLLAKLGFRFLLTLLLTVAILAILLFRAQGALPSLYWGTRPYVTWYLTLSILVAQLVVLAVTMAVSVRAPYQSTALIIGGTLGIVLAAFPVTDELYLVNALQAPWGNFWILVVFLALTTLLAAWGTITLETGRSRS